MFERLFEELTDITRKTWNRRIEDLVSNAVLHKQAEKITEGNATSTCIIRQEKEITNLSKSLPKLGNTVLPKEVIDKHAGHWEAHLRSIADFLEPGYGVWWKETEEECIEFFDGPEEADFREQGPSLHHFRSSNVTKEQNYIQKCWEECREKGVKMPATKLRDSTGKWHYPETCLSSQIHAEEQHVEENLGELNMPHAAAFECENDTDEDEDGEDLRSEWQAEETSTENNQENELFSEAIVPEENDHLTSACSDHEYNDTAGDDCTNEPVPKKPREDVESLSSKTGQAIAQVLGTTKDVLTYEKLKNNVTKNPTSRYHKEHYLNHLAIIQVQVQKEYKAINQAITKWSTQFKQTNNKNPCEDDRKRDPSIAQTCRKKKVASQLLKLWKITVHLS